MSFVITDTSTVFTAPVQVAFAAAGSNPAAIAATAAPVQVGGGTTTPVAGAPAGAIGSVTASNTQTYTTTNAAAGQTQQVVVSGAGTKANIGTGAAKVQAIGGGTIVEAVQSQADTGKKIISLGDNTVAYNGVAVNTAATVSSVVVDPKTGVATTKTATISEVSGGQGGPFAYYAHGGFGDDQIEGSNLADFIRGGAGNDTINGYGGNDLIRGGTGSDSIYGGIGTDTLYYTADQFPAVGSTDTDTFVDFVTTTDKISFDKGVVASTANITGLGTNTITVSSGGSTIKVVSGGTAINAGDINFI